MDGEIAGGMSNAIVALKNQGTKTLKEGSNMVGDIGQFVCKTFIFLVFSAIKTSIRDLAYIRIREGALNLVCGILPKLHIQT